MQVRHLGDESLMNYIRAELALAKGYECTIVGRGPSMEPIIPDGTRMWWEPYTGQEITPGMPLFCRFSLKHYSCHMVWIVTPSHILIGTSQGALEGWVTRRNVLGFYKGAWNEHMQEG